jgi:single-stranded-DNA-specific exonuclease
MPPLTKRWQVARQLDAEAELNLQDYPPILRKILFNRGYSTPEAARQYLRAEAPGGTDPNNMLGIPEAVKRISFAIGRRESIAIYGDYDVDGVTATALLTQILRRLGADVRGYIPNRFEEGYGLNNEAIDSLHLAGVKLVITVDCGIRSIAEADHARRLGVDLIISDHHHPGSEIPHALAVIDPKQPGDPYPEKELAGVGLAYKLAAALIEQVNEASDPSLNVEDTLDLVALGTVADLAPLVGENRALVRAGLKRMRQPTRQGFMSLIGVSGLKAANITASDIGYALGPRLNAAGRLDSALAALELLLTEDIFKAGQISQQLEIQNRERQQITREIFLLAEQLALAEDPNALLLFAADPSFNPGVVGLAASRLTETYYRPAIVAQKGEYFTRGSCRSIPEFHITHALDQCAELMDHHGGHAAAAGFTVRNENLPLLVDCLRAQAKQELSQLDLRPTLTADIELPLSDLNVEILKYLEMLEPTGTKNQQAVFVTRNIKLKNSRAVGKENAHLKLTVTDGYITYDAIAFRQGHWLGQLPDKLDLMYTFEINEFNGRSTLQLNVRDLKPAGSPD